MVSNFYKVVTNFSKVVSKMLAPIFLISFFLTKDNFFDYIFNLIQKFLVFSNSVFHFRTFYKTVSNLSKVVSNFSKVVTTEFNQVSIFSSFFRRMLNKFQAFLKWFSHYPKWFRNFSTFKNLSRYFQLFYYPLSAVKHLSFYS